MKKNFPPSFAVDPPRFLGGRGDVKMKVKNIIFILGIYFLILNLIGCDAFVRKFTRKRKTEELPREEMVLAPEEYKPTMTKEEMYRQYLLFWKSWQDELIEALIYSKNHKKQVDCAKEAIKNLMGLKTLLNADRQKKLDIYINQSIDLRDLIVQDPYGNDTARNRQKAESIKRNLLRDFSFNKIKDYLI